MHSLRWIQGDMDMIWKRMNLYVSNTSRYACMMYVSHATSVHVQNVCMFFRDPYYIRTYMHVSNHFQSLWWSLTHEYCNGYTSSFVTSSADSARHIDLKPVEIKSLIDSTRRRQVVGWPNHGPRVDVVPRAARPRGAKRHLSTSPTFPDF